MEVLDVVVVGGGHAGLSASYFLCKNELSHIVFERGKIGESWRSQRWDTFKVNTPNFINILPEHYTSGSDPDSFMSGNEFANYLAEYANKHTLPVNEDSKVISIESDGSNFIITIEHNDHVQHYLSKHVIIASGALSSYKLPAVSKAVPENILQMHAAEYKNPTQLPDGGVLVVGGAQSGCQIAEDLADSSRSVFLASSKVTRIPRIYRGKDITHWLTAMKLFDVPTVSVTDPQMLTAPPPQLSGTGKMGHTVSYQHLKSRGVRIFGHLNFVEDNEFIFGPEAKANVKFADESSQMVKSLIDDYISGSGITAIPNDYDAADLPDVECSCAEDISYLDCEKDNITSVIWCTGFTGNFNYIKLPVLTTHGMPVHHNGVSSVRGLYFLGFPWLRTRKSGIIYGIAEDAQVITNEIAEQVFT